MASRDFSQAIQSEGQNILRCVVIPTCPILTLEAMVLSLREALGLSRATVVGILCRIGRVHEFQTPNSFCRFVGEELLKLIPTRVGDVFCKRCCLDHFLDGEIFEVDELIVLDNFSRFLVAEVFALIPDFVMDLGNDFALFLSLRASFEALGQLALGLGEPLLSFFEKTRVCNGLPVRQCCKVLKSHIDANGFLLPWQGLDFDFAGKTDVPVARGVLAEGAGFHLSFKGFMHLNFKYSEFGEGEFFAGEGKSALGITQAVIPVGSTKSGKSRFFSGLTSPEKILKGFVESIGYILQDLGMNLV